MRDGFIRKKVQKVVSKTGVQIIFARYPKPDPDYQQFLDSQIPLDSMRNPT